MITVSCFLLLGVPLLIFLGITWAIASIIIAIIQGICEGIFGVIEQGIDNIGKKK